MFRTKIKIHGLKRTFEPLTINDGIRDYIIVVLPVVYQWNLRWDKRESAKIMESRVRRGKNVSEVGQNKKTSGDEDLTEAVIVDLGETNSRENREGEKDRDIRKEGDKTGLGEDGKTENAAIWLNRSSFVYKWP